MEKIRRGFWILDFGLPIGRRGQSIIEYLVVAAAVITAVLAIGGVVQGRVTNLGNAAGGQIDAAGAAITANVTAAAQ